MAEELVLEEKAKYPGIEALQYDVPARAVQARSGWIYHSTSLGARASSRSAGRAPCMIHALH